MKKELSFAEIITEFCFYGTIVIAILYLIDSNMKQEEVSARLESKIDSLGSVVKSKHDQLTKLKHITARYEEMFTMMMVSDVKNNPILYKRLEEQIRSSKHFKGVSFSDILKNSEFKFRSN